MAAAKLPKPAVIAGAAAPVDCAAVEPVEPVEVAVVPLVWLVEPVPVLEPVAELPVVTAVAEEARVMLVEEVPEVAVPVDAEFQVLTCVKEQDLTRSRTSLSASSLAATQASHSGMKLLALLVEQTQLMKPESSSSF